MAQRSFDEVLSELVDEGHPPMVELVKAIEQEAFAKSLGYDLSMLRLWLSRSRSEDNPELMVTYGDGRHGGRPTPPFVDAYELNRFNDHLQRTAVGNLRETIAAIRAWYERR